MVHIFGSCRTRLVSIGTAGARQVRPELGLAADAIHLQFTEVQMVATGFSDVDEASHAVDCEGAVVYRRPTDS